MASLIQFGESHMRTFIAIQLLWLALSQLLWSQPAYEVRSVSSSYVGSFTNGGDVHLVAFSGQILRLIKEGIDPIGTLRSADGTTVDNVLRCRQLNDRALLLIRSDYSVHVVDINSALIVQSFAECPLGGIVDVSQLNDTLFFAITTERIATVYNSRARLWTQVEDLLGTQAISQFEGGVLLGTNRAELIRLVMVPNSTMRRDTISVGLPFPPTQIKSTASGDEAFLVLREPQRSSLFKVDLRSKVLDSCSIHAQQFILAVGDSNILYACADVLDP